MMAGPFNLGLDTAAAPADGTGLMDSAAQEIDALKSFVASTVADLTQAVSDHLDMMEARYRILNQELPAAVAGDISAIKSTAQGAIDTFNKETLVKVAGLASKVSGAAGAAISLNMKPEIDALKNWVTSNAAALAKALDDKLAQLEQLLFGGLIRVAEIAAVAVAALIIVPLLFRGGDR
jgi:hypothetical protein